ncbi:hypothetical protein ZIOFF_036988 [Zingiber officinale]|uniref:UBX domain-containing protein n=1 Tax=Zingiber officinale TaxID=94328 RepID=A0A8J5GJC1_ZINOF|nr:hypothetical protein ZIOFF_036988 [Zingiber officinale]
MALSSSASRSFSRSVDISPISDPLSATLAGCFPLISPSYSPISAGSIDLDGCTASQGRLLLLLYLDLSSQRFLFSDFASVSSFLDAVDACIDVAKLLAVEKELGHAVRVFTNTASFANPGEISSSSTEEPDEFYEFTPDDYYRIMSDRIGAQSQILKTRKMREAEKATRRAKVTKCVVVESRGEKLLGNVRAWRRFLPKEKMLHAGGDPPEVIAFDAVSGWHAWSRRQRMRDGKNRGRTHAVIRVRFPDKYVLEAKFQPSETLQSLMDLLKKVVARPDLPFYIYTTPPKERVKDTSKDFYSAGFAPGAIVYFSYDLPKDLESDDSKEGPYLRDDILSLNGLDLPIDRVDPAHPEEELKGVQIPSSAPDPKPPAKKPAKPKWLKL